MTTHAIALPDSFDTAYLFMTIFDLYSPSVAEYENQDVPKIYVTAEEPQWDPSTNEYSERDT